MLEVFHLLMDQSYMWDEIGRELGIEISFREGLRREGHASTNENKLERVIAKWKKSSSEVSWNILKKALEILEQRDTIRKVNEYLQKYPNGPQ